MQHSTPEQLALAALREPLPPEDAAHLERCDTCRAEVARLRRAPDLLSVPQLAAPGAAVPPPPRVWEAIAAATGVRTSPATDAPGTPELVAVPVPAAPDEAPGGTVSPLRRRRRPLLLAAAAAVAGAVVGAGAVAVVQSAGDDDETVATVALDLLPEASGVADVVVRDDGSRVLELDLDAPAPEDGSYYEVWVIDRSVQGMFPLGAVEPGTQSVELPDGLDLAEYPLLDVSVEPLDGDPTHSGVSVARGDLDA
ncbi:ABC transporter substrate-binding protein [Blastococcus sp. TF02-09]|uniref:anti-sigma factor n=1 Tax=Blastococcus sp. TF02-09 TaxID=2250576 RepID=UPI000DE8995B|nr:anti-sigma factor [Blastococcus sp. TF02-9]RBY74383.1 ABC transporter substrate-binding protein [Blastococcus sp. TF02-9]